MTTHRREVGIMLIALFFIGVAVGIALHRLIMAMVLERSPDTLCTYCEFFRQKKRRHKK